MAFTGFADFLLLTREERLSPDVVRNEAMKQNYTYSELIRGKAIEKLTQGGTALKLFIRVSTTGSYQNYGPGDEWTPQAGDNLQGNTVPWRFSTVNFGFYDEEDLLNKKGASSFADLLEIYEGNCVIDFVEGVESSLWAVPSTNDMEATGGKSPYSIPTVINEYTYTLPTGFTTVYGINPTTYSVWRNQRAGYSASNILNPTATNGLAYALDNAIAQINFKPVPFSPASKYQDDAMMERVIMVTNLDGYNTYQALLRSMNDRTVSPQDVHYGNIMFDGRDVCWVNALATAAIYSGASLAASHSSGVATTGYPRFYLINTEHLCPILNSDMFFEKLPLENGGPTKPNFKVQYVRSAWNLRCSSRKRHAIVYPSAA